MKEMRALELICSPIRGTTCSPQFDAQACSDGIRVRTSPRRCEKNVLQTENLGRTKLIQLTDVFLTSE